MTQDKDWIHKDCVQKLVADQIKDQRDHWKEMYELQRGENESLLKSLHALHPRHDVWVTPNAELADYIERAIRRSQG